MATEKQTRAAELNAIPSRSLDKKTWPKGVRTISLNELDGLGVDDSGRLHWHGQPVEIIGQRLVLTTAQRVWAVIIAIVGLLAAVGTVAQGWVAGHDWLCRVGWIVTWCGQP